MTQKAKRTTTKKTAPKPKQAPDAQTSLEQMVNAADQCIIVTATKGNVVVTGIKNVSYSHEAKGMLIGALDSYMVRPILQSLNTVNQNIAAQFANFINKTSPEVSDESEE
jgi:TATA-box binding protein (TBP) (component of TFIID and TFIIIB)